MAYMGKESKRVGLCIFITYSLCQTPETNNTVNQLFNSVQSLSRVWLFAIPWTAACQALPVYHQLPELTQTHVHWVGDAIQPSRPLSSPSPLALTLSQNQGLFKWVSSSYQVAKVLEFQFNISPSNERLGLIFRMDCSPRDSQESSPTPQFKSINFSVLSFLYGPTLTSIHDHWKNHSLD